MKKKAFMFFLLLSILLSACSESKLLNFVGESENWYVDYEVNIIDQSSEESMITIRYIGGKPYPKEVTYLIESTTGKAGGTDNLDDDGLLISGGRGCSGCAVIQEHEKLNAIITWDDKSETLTLTNE